MDTKTIQTSKLQKTAVASKQKTVHKSVTPDVAKRFETPGMYLTIAKKYSGKTYLLKWMIYELAKAGKFDYGMVFSGTAHTGEWNIVPSRQIFSAWKECKPVIEKLLEHQGKLKSEGSKVPRVFLVLDDIVGNIPNNDQLMARLATSARHWNITLFVCVQSVTKIPPVFRQNAEYVFVFRQANSKQVDAIYEEFGGLFGTKPEFAQYLNDNVEDHRALFINNKTQSNDKKDVFGLIKAPLKVPDFFIGK